MFLLLERVFLYYQGENILHNISFKIDQGEYVGLVGPNGAGKTKLLQIILGILKPSSGVVKRSDDITIGYVPQDFIIDTHFSISVQEILELGLKRRSIWKRKTEKKYFLQKLQTVALDKSILDKPFHSLSGGQKQRVAIAQSLLLEPQMLLFDEPLNGLDYSVKIQIYQLLNKINQELKTTILLVSHEIEHLTRHCSKILCLNKKLYNDCDPIKFVLGQEVKS